MNASMTARERARAELTEEIKASARRQLADAGAAQLSLRAVARDLGMVSSAIYRYFPSRDELLTALITDAYDAVGEALERAVDDGDEPRARWRACADALRAWARANPHEYALIYGSPVPGYRAPDATIAAAARSAVVIARIAAEATMDAGVDGPLGAELERQVRLISDIVAPGTSPRVMARGLIAWTQLYGMVSFELFGQFANTLDPADEFFAYAVERTADLIGLP
ncbi:TetR/AcrR family transcriptional regulator [Tsukamurella soli]|uniref:TetR/AcrR family transcriptional regulator n=1 Tax=Tsukamurella soli TaxID=644556 RepID=UPI0031E65D47